MKYTINIISKRQVLVYPERAINAGAEEVALFTAVTESFNLRNTNCSTEESLARAKQVLKKALDQKLRVRGYLSCVLGCPYKGNVNPEKVVLMAKELYDAGCLGDTINVGTVESMATMLEYVLKVVPAEAVAVHCHDTYGQALLANILKALEYGIRVVDSSVAVYMLHGMGFKTGVDLDALIETGQWISEQINRPTSSRAGAALMVARQRKLDLAAAAKLEANAPKL
ncbi:hypothetical protein BD770DRAFT_440358 [Pilaira anomala]|nr:hypothetical protein BD770DRAFT_440358 [Pilaira anomala]